MYKYALFLLAVLANLLVLNQADYVVLPFLPINPTLFIFTLCMGYVKTVLRSEPYWTTPLCYFLGFYMMDVFKRVSTKAFVMQVPIISVTCIVLERLMVAAETQRFPLHLNELMAIIVLFAIQVYATRAISSTYS